MSTSPDVIAWLVPTSRNTPADKATRLAGNAPLAVTTASSRHLLSRLSALTNAPQAALQLTFTHQTHRPGKFVLGTDPQTCDVVLPALPGVARQHCAIGFDARCRLTLDDFSPAGTQVWYGWECSGDQRNHSWLLSAVDETGSVPAAPRITIDIQGVRFLVVVSDAAADWGGYKERVDAFCKEPPPELDGPAAPWHAWHAQPSRMRHVLVKHRDAGDVYLWDLSRPWEPLVKASA